MELARNCLEHDHEDGAGPVMRDVMRNAQNNAANPYRTVACFEKAGAAEFGQT